MSLLLNGRPICFNFTKLICPNMTRTLFTVLFAFLFTVSFAQDKEQLFGPVEKPDSRKGFLLNGNGAVDLPGGDMAKRFGTSFKLGPALLYKTASNWIIGVKFDFIVGSKIHEDSLMINIKDKYSANTGSLYEFINNSGERVGIPLYERGYAVGIQVGRIISFSKSHPDNGLTLLTSVGFLQHKIDIFDRDKFVSQIRGDYLKGYDRLTNGLYIGEYAGYTYFAKNGLLNFTIGIDGMVGFTKCRRDYLYDLMRPDNKQRLDVLVGLRGGWFIPIFKRKSEDILFE